MCVIHFNLIVMFQPLDWASQYHEKSKDNEHNATTNLEQILMLHEQKGYARSIDIATGLSVSKPSVSFAMKQLRENGYITMDKDNYISLTDKGMDIASAIYARHKALTTFLTRLGVDPAVAREDAKREQRRKNGKERKRRENEGAARF